MTGPHAPVVSHDLSRPALVMAAVATSIAALLLALAGWTAYETATYVPAPREDTSLAGLGYVVAVVIAVPAALAAVLGVLGVLVARRHRGAWAFGLAVSALASLLPLAYVASAFLRPA